MSAPATVLAPRVALFSNAQQFFWSGAPAIPFNGFALIGLVAPSDGTTPWSIMDYGNLYPSIQLPVWQRIPIINGSLNNGCGCFLNSDITPPGSQYIVYYYDATGRQIAGPSSPFTVTTQNTFTPPILTLTIPSTVGPNPTPDV